MSSDKQIKQLKKDIMFDIKFYESVLKVDYDHHITFSKSDIIQTFKSLKRSIKYKFKRLKHDKWKAITINYNYYFNYIWLSMVQRQQKKKWLLEKI